MNEGVVFTSGRGPAERVDALGDRGANYTEIPSIVVAFFACPATRRVAKYRLGPRSTDPS